jgi:hypothetical protein
MRTAALAAVLSAILAAAVYAAVRVWISLSGSEISANGMIALVLGAVVTLALGAGLMALVFYSHRRGHDDDHF